MGFTRAELQACAGQTVPDVLPDPLRLLFVGINPGLWSAAAQAHFARPGNRFYPALYRAGITSHPFDTSRGYLPADLAELHRLGIGITNLVARASARADELTTAELTAGAEGLRRLVERHRPAVVAVLGITAYRRAFGDRQAPAGRQPSELAGCTLYVLPNPSGLNAHASLDALAASFREVAVAAGVPVHSPPGAPRGASPVLPG